MLLLLSYNLFPAQRKLLDGIAVYIYLPGNLCTHKLSLPPGTADLVLKLAS